MKDGAYVVNPNEYKLIGIKWVAFYETGNDTKSFYSF